MIQIEETLYGYRVLFPERVDEVSLQEWIKSSRHLLDERKEPFRAIFDMRRSGELTGRAKLLWDVGLNLYRYRGMDEGIVLWPDGHLADIHNSGNDHFLDMTA